jgi:ABC-type uncharacterized transport system auxiliary subunit
LSDRGRRGGTAGAAAVLAAALAGACASPPAPRWFEIEYRLAPPAPDAATSSGPRLVVGGFTAHPRCEREEIAYRKSETELGYYPFHRWALRPAEMVRLKLAEDLAASGRFGAVTLSEHSGGTRPGDVVLVGHLERLEERDGPGGATGRLRLELTLADRDGSGARTTTLEGEAPADAATADAAVRAISQAMADAVARWLREERY